MELAEAEKPTPPSYWRGSYVQRVETLEELRIYIEMMLEVTRGRDVRLSALTNAIRNADAWFTERRTADRPEISPEPKTEYEAEATLDRKLHWIDSQGKSRFKATSQRNTNTTIERDLEWFEEWTSGVHGDNKSSMARELSRREGKVISRQMLSDALKRAAMHRRKGSQMSK